MTREAPMAVVIAVALLLGCSSGPTVTLPPDTPLSLSSFCAWAAHTPLAFAGWATLAQLGQADASGQVGSSQLVFAVVSRDRISRVGFGGGGPQVARGMCFVEDDQWSETGVADDWQLGG